MPTPVPTSNTPGIITATTGKSFELSPEAANLSDWLNSVVVAAVVAAGVMLMYDTLGGWLDEDVRLSEVVLESEVVRGNVVEFFTNEIVVFVVLEGESDVVVDSLVCGLLIAGVAGIEDTEMCGKTSFINGFCIY